MLASLADVIVRRSGLVVATVMIVAGGSSLGILRLEGRFAPEDLVASAPGERLANDHVPASFDTDDRTVAVVLTARDVLAPDVLTALHAVALRLEREPFVDRVDAITRTPLPVVVPHEERGETLEDLDAAAGGDDAPAAPPEVLDALARFAAEDPERYPLGIASLVEGIGGRLEVRPLVRGDAPAPAEVAAIGAAAESPLVRGRLVSADRTVALVLARLDRRIDDPDALRDRIDRLDRAVKSVRPPRGAETWLTGIPPLRASITKRMTEDQSILVPLTIAMSALVLFVFLRSAAGVLLPLAAAGLSTGALVGGMGLVGAPLDIVTSVVPPLLVTLGLSDGLHLVIRHRDELARSGDAGGAARRTLRAMFLPCLLTSLTTAIGFGSFVIAHGAILKRFGAIATIGIAIAFVVSIAFVPAALARAPQKAPPPRTYASLSRRVAGVVAFAARAPKVVLALAVVVVASCIVASSEVRIDTALLDSVDRDDAAYVGTRLLERKLLGVRALDVVLVSRREHGADDPAVIAALERTAAWARGQPGVLGTTSTADVLGPAISALSGGPATGHLALASAAQVRAAADLVRAGAPDADPLEPWRARDGTAVRLRVHFEDIGAERLRTLVAAIEARVARETVRLEGVRATVGGEAAIAARGLGVLAADLLGTAGVTAILVFLAMGVALRSVRMLLIAILPNLAPLAVTVAYMVLRGIPLNVTTLLLFSVTIGLAVDGTIHFLSRFREESAKGGTIEAIVARTAAGTGSAITVGALALVAGFAVLTQSSFAPVRQLGEVGAVTLAACWLADIVLLPALLVVFPPRR